MALPPRLPGLSILDAAREAVEAFFSRRENVVLFFIGRYVLIIAMLVAFWFLCRSF